MLAAELPLVTRDLKHIWHPCSQMKDYETFKPLDIVGASGSYLYLRQGKKIIDAIGSWWCKSLGHHHPQIKKVLEQQINQFEHVMLVNTTNEVIVALSEKLTSLTPSLDKIMFACDGSSAIEIALKMSVHARLIRGETQRTHFLALKNSYHGETIGAMSVSDIGIYCEPYQKLLFKSHFISPPYVLGFQDGQWDNDDEAHWKETEFFLNSFRETATALIVEPIVQATSGMRLYNPQFLTRLRRWTKDNNIHLIADEIMTGIGRTGKMLACQHAKIEPDFLCLGKGLTSGWLPMSAMLTSTNIYQLFYADYAEGKSFLHSHTYSGNALAARVALEVIKIIEEKSICDYAVKLGKQMFDALSNIAHHTKKLKNVRGIGAIVAADLISDDPNERLGFRVYQKAVELGALLRPLGNTIYWCPPLTMTEETLEALAEITQKAIQV